MRTRLAAFPKETRRVLYNYGISVYTVIQTADMQQSCVFHKTDLRRKEHDV